MNIYKYVFCCPKLIDSKIRINKHFCKRDLNFKNSGMNNLRKTAFSSDPCCKSHVSSFQPIVVQSLLKKGLKVIHDITLFLGVSGFHFWREFRYTIHMLLYIFFNSPISSDLHKFINLADKSTLL